MSKTTAKFIENVYTFSRDDKNDHRFPLKEDLNNLELGQLGLIVDPFKLYEEMIFWHKRYKDEIIEFLRTEWYSYETSEPVEVDAIIEYVFELDLTLKQVIKRLQDVRTPMSFVNHLHKLMVVEREKYYTQNSEQ
jgi:hypothetical protein